MPGNSKPRAAQGGGTSGGRSKSARRSASAGKSPTSTPRGKLSGLAAKTRTKAGARKRARGGTSVRAGADRVRLLTGGNPQIAKGDGDAPVQAYIAAMPGWKREVGMRLDALIARAVPGVRKAVKWNSPFYGAENESAGWFLGVHCFTHYVKVAFFRGTELRPLPPGASKDKNTRYLDIREGELGSAIDESQLADWIRQAAALPGWVP